LIGPAPAHRLGSRALHFAFPQSVCSSLALTHSYLHAHTTQPTYSPCLLSQQLPSLSHPLANFAFTAVYSAHSAIALAWSLQLLTARFPIPAFRQTIHSNLRSIPPSPHPSSPHPKWQPTNHLARSTATTPPRATRTATLLAPPTSHPRSNRLPSPHNNKRLPRSPRMRSAGTLSSSTTPR
jgi:hypothetical protein